ncbi:MAG: hypothetical protein ACLQJ7_10585 [Syntrophobacteraceae bacterium]
MSKRLIVALALSLVLVSGGIYSAYSAQADCGREGMSQSDLQTCGFDTIR